MGKVILPPHIEEVEGLVIFLAGPIQGAQFWQDEAIRIIQALDPGTHIASPRRGVGMEGDFTEAMYAEQVDWETKYLRRAARQGAVLFWLSREHVHIHERAYAQTSRFEIGEWKERHMRDGTKLVIGIEEGFSGARYIRHRFGQDCPEVPFVSSLREACEAAVRLARS